MVKSVESVESFNKFPYNCTRVLKIRATVASSSSFQGPLKTPGKMSIVKI